MSGPPPYPFRLMGGKHAGRIEVDAHVLAAAVLAGEKVTFLGPPEHLRRVEGRAKEILASLARLAEFPPTALTQASMLFAWMASATWKHRTAPLDEPFDGLPSDAMDHGFCPGCMGTGRVSRVVPVDDVYPCSTCGGDGLWPPKDWRGGKPVMAP